jgi:hypothetical protein
MLLLGRSCHRVLLTSALIIVLSTAARANGLTEWDLKFLSDKLGIGSLSLSMLELTPQEEHCIHLMINRFGSDEKLMADVTRFLDEVAANKVIDRNSSTKCLR